jgi:hypothetical protein
VSPGWLNIAGSDENRPGAAEGHLFFVGVTFGPTIHRAAPHNKQRRAVAWIQIISTRGGVEFFNACASDFAILVVSPSANCTPPIHIGARIFTSTNGSLKVGPRPDELFSMSGNSRDDVETQGACDLKMHRCAQPDRGVVILELRIGVDGDLQTIGPLCNQQAAPIGVNDAAVRDIG